MPKLLYQGHGSYRVTSDKNIVVYVDPFAGAGYDLPADLILVTHEHSDHNQVCLVTRKPSCLTITEAEALADGRYNRFMVQGIEILAVPAYNRNHKRQECVGYVLVVDGVKLYAAGDTSRTEEMESLLPSLQLDYALLPIDGHYNMGPNEAAECARTIGAKHNIPIHMAPGSLFDRSTAEQFQAANRLILEPGQEIAL